MPDPARQDPSHKKSADRRSRLALFFLAQIDLDLARVDPGGIDRHATFRATLEAGAGLETETPTMAETNRSPILWRAPVKQIAFMGTYVFDRPNGVS